MNEYTLVIKGNIGDSIAALNEKCKYVLRYATKLKCKPGDCKQTIVKFVLPANVSMIGLLNGWMTDSDKYAMEDGGFQNGALIIWLRSDS